MRKIGEFTRTHTYTTETKTRCGRFFEFYKIFNYVKEQEKKNMFQRSFYFISF